MKTLCYIIAMQAEAQPFIDHYGVELQPGFFDPLPCQCYRGKAGAIDLYVVLCGRQHGTDLVGCEAATLATHAALRQIRPDLVVNSGTCGGFASCGARIADVYVGSGAMFHDRRVPGDDAWGTQGLGNYPVWAGSGRLADRLGYKTGKVTTGSSLDMQPCDLEIIQRGGGELKDMEGAAVAFVCSLMGVPVLFVKSVTDLCDSGAETIDEFRRNLARASQALRDANVRIIGALGEWASEGDGQ